MKNCLKIATMLLLSLALFSCKKNEPVEIGSATCTFMPGTNGSFYISVDEKTAFVPTNIKVYPFAAGKEQRTFINYSIDKKNQVSPVPGYNETVAVEVLTFNPLRTKSPLKFDPEESYGDDPIGLYLGNDVFPTTLIEDGYLNLSFVFPYGTGAIQHEINLVYGQNPLDPFEVTVHHDAHSDTGFNTIADVFCFPLKDLPDTKGETVTLTLRWYSLNSGKWESTTFPYKSRTDWSTL